MHHWLFFCSKMSELVFPQVHKKRLIAQFFYKKNVMYLKAQSFLIITLKWCMAINDSWNMKKTALKLAFS